MGRKNLQIIIAFLLLVSVSGGGLNKPILVEKEVTTEIKIKQLDKDELQRVLEECIEKINSLEDRVILLEGKVRTLELGQE
jgi:TolA-binding protein